MRIFMSSSMISQSVSRKSSKITQFAFVFTRDNFMMGFKMVIEQIFEEKRSITYMTSKISLTKMLFQMIF